MHIADDGGVVVTVGKTMSRPLRCGETYTSHPITYIGQPGPKKSAIDVPAPRSDGQRSYKFVILQSKAFPLKTVLLRTLLLSPMFSDPPGLAGLRSAYPECNDHCIPPVSDNRRQKVRGVPSRPRLHVLVCTLGTVFNQANKMRQMTCRTLVGSPVGADNRNVFEKY